MQSTINSFLNPDHGMAIILNFSCRKLLKMDIISASDPQLFLYFIDKGQKQFIGESERIKDTHDPDFTHDFKVFYHFECKMFFEVEVWDIDKSSKDFLGRASFELGQLVAERGQNMKINLNNKKKQKIKSELIIKYEKLIKSKNILSFKFRCKKIEDIEWFSKSDPFLRFYKYSKNDKNFSDSISVKDPNWQITHQTEFYMNNLNPKFNKFMIQDQKFTKGSPQQPLKVEVWDYSKKGKHSMIGYQFFTLQEILNGNKTWTFISVRKKKKAAGNLILEQFTTEPSFDFLDYLYGGLILNSVVGIDFTLSNIEPYKPNSLHHIRPNFKNQYQLALEGILSIIENYDIDKMFPVYGFGGKIHNKTSHCFALNGNESNPDVNQVMGVLNIYQQAINVFKLSGPTYFEPLINRTIEIAKFQNNIMSYQILCIFTDGIIIDMNQTIDKIVEASFYPISIIIIGVGNADFSAMEFLDSDDKKLKSSNGSLALRDIVQFVPFSKFQSDPVRLAAETLAEVPNQVVEFYRIKKIVPRAQKLN